MYPETAEEIFTEAAERAKQEQNPQRPMEKGSKKKKKANQQQVGSPVTLDSDGGNLKPLKPPPWAFEKRGPAVSRRESDQVQLQGHEAQRPIRC